MNQPLLQQESYNGMRNVALCVSTTLIRYCLNEGFDAWTQYTQKVSCHVMFGKAAVFYSYNSLFLYF